VSRVYLNTIARQISYRSSNIHLNPTIPPTLSFPSSNSTRTRAIPYPNPDLSAPTPIPGPAKANPVPPPVCE
ncbi:hypothetical protein FA13DRAFT_1735271, partial [Coprinellus micaceus]